MQSKWRFLLKPYNLFLLLAIPLHYTLFFHGFPLQSYSYFHGTERFLHSVSATYAALHGENDVIPSDYLALAYRASPGIFMNKFYRQLPAWRRQMQNSAFLAPGEPCTRIPQIGYQRQLMKCLANAPTPPRAIVPFHSIFSAGEYSLLGYLPYMAGLAVALLLDLPPFTAYVFSEITNLAVLLALGYATLRLTPVLARPLMFLLLLPSMFAMRTFYMPDGLAIELSFLLLALILHLRQQKQPLRLPEQVALAALSIGVAVVKVVYFLLPMLLFLLPAELFGTWRQKYCRVGLLVAISIAAACMWNMHSIDIYYPVKWDAAWDASQPLPRPVMGVRVNEAYLRLIKDNPLGMLRLTVNQWVTPAGLYNTFTNAGFWSRWIVSRFWTGNIPRILSFYFLGIAALAWMEGGVIRRELAFSLAERVLVAGILVATILLISVIIFAFWGGQMLSGTWLVRMQQGRYFIPVFPLVPLLLPWIRRIKENAWFFRLRNGTCIVLVAMTLYLNYLYQLYF